MKVGNLEVYGVIYKITNIINGKVYIGQTIVGFNERYNRAGIGIERVYNYYNCRRNSIKNKGRKISCNYHLLKSIEKYGFDNFEVNEVFDIAFSKEELDIKEYLWINYYNCMNKKYGYNNKEGGANGSCSEQTKSKMRYSQLGKHLSEETKEKLRQYNLGKTLSEETKEKISNKLLGRKLSEEAKEKLSKSKMGENNPMYGKKGKDNPFSKKVLCITTGKEFDSAQLASDYYGIKSKSHLCACCRGERKSCGKLEDGTKLQWKYIEESA